MAPVKKIQNSCSTRGSSLVEDETKIALEIAILSMAEKVAAEPKAG